MQVLTVVRINKTTNSIGNMYAFNGAGHEDVAKAEAKFVEECKALNVAGFSHFTKEDWDGHVENGYFNHGNTSIQLCWSTNQITTLAVYGDAKR